MGATDAVPLSPAKRAEISRSKHDENVMESAEVGIGAAKAEYEAELAKKKKKAQFAQLIEKRREEEEKQRKELIEQEQKKVMEEEVQRAKEAQAKVSTCLMLVGLSETCDAALP